MARRKTVYEKKPRKRRYVEAVLKNKFNGVAICGYCGEAIADDEVTLDHVVPVSKGGTDRVKNMVLCCTTCNNKKGDKEWEPKYRTLKDLPPERRPPKKRRPSRRRTAPVLGTIGDVWPDS